MCLFMCVPWVCTRGHMKAKVSGVSPLRNCPPCFLRQILLQDWNLFIKLDWLAA